MAELEEPVKGATSYAFSPKGKPTDSKSKVKPLPTPAELSSAEPNKDKQKEREKEHEKDETTLLSRKGTKIGHRRIDEAGQITYKKVGRLSSKVERDVLMGDFYEIESVVFPSDGRQETPAHHYSDFRFKAYAPVAFRYFRELFHIAPDDFLISLCHETLRELTNPGASGSLFYLSMDDQFIIKTVQHKEAEFLQKLLPGYYLNLNQNKRTLLPKFFGLYCYQCGGKNIRLVVMNNLLPSGYKIHLKYDLKGSTFKRKASKAERAKSSPTLKDLDFMNDHPDGISLEVDTYNVLLKTIQRDCRVLESFKIMDYSLLLAIHNVDEAAREKREARGEPSSTAGTKPTEAVATSDNSNEDRKPSEKSTNELAKGLQGSSGVARNPSGRNRDDFSAYWEAIPQHRDDNATPYGAIRARNNKGDRLLLFIGIIDILQSYRLKKRLEHGLKSVVQDGDAISVHRPSFYSKRFQEFMSEKVFRKIPAPRPQITRSPSKKRASFNTGRARERIRTSSDTDKHNRVGEHSKGLATKPALSPSLPDGLANRVPGDVSFMGQGTKSLETVPGKSSTASALRESKNGDVPKNAEETSRKPEESSKKVEFVSNSSQERSTNMGDVSKNSKETSEKPDDLSNSSERASIQPEDVPSTSEGRSENIDDVSKNSGETSHNLPDNLPNNSDDTLKNVDGVPKSSQELPEKVDDNPNTPGPSLPTENDTKVEVPVNEIPQDSSDSEPASEDSHI